jgi:hypothetical protein
MTGKGHRGRGRMAAGARSADAAPMPAVWSVAVCALQGGTPDSTAVTATKAIHRGLAWFLIIVSSLLQGLAGCGGRSWVRASISDQGCPRVRRQHASRDDSRRRHRNHRTVGQFDADAGSHGALGGEHPAVWRDRKFPAHGRRRGSVRSAHAAVWLGNIRSCEATEGSPRTRRQGARCVQRFARAKACRESQALITVRFTRRVGRQIGTTPHRHRTGRDQAHITSRTGMSVQLAEPKKLPPAALRFRVKSPTAIELRRVGRRQYWSHRRSFESRTRTDGPVPIPS